MKSERRSSKQTSATPIGRIGAILFVAVFASALLGLAQGLPANATVEEAVNSRFKFSPKSGDGNPVAVEAGTVLVVRMPGIMSIPFGPTPIPLSSYKEGSLHPPGFMQRALTGAQPAAPLRIDQRVYLVNIEMNVKGDNFTLVVFGCDECNGSYSRAAVTFQFAKGYFKTAEAPAQVLRVIDEVFSVDGASNRSRAVSSQILTDAAPEADRPPVPGSVYVSALDNADRLGLNPGDSFSLQEGGKSFTGTYSIAGTTLTLHIVELGKDVPIAIQGNRLIVGGDEVWIQPVVARQDPVSALGAGTESGQQGVPPDLVAAIEAGKELSFPIKYASTGPSVQRTSGFYGPGAGVGLVVGMADGVLTLSKTTFAFSGPCLIPRGFGRYEHCDFRISPSKILELENQPALASRLHVKVAIKNAKGDKEDKKDYYFYNVAAQEVGDGTVGGPGTSIVCSGCDDSMDIPYALIRKVRELDFRAPREETTSPIVGKYMRKDKNTDYVELYPAGTFDLLQGGKNYTGSYKVQADTITVQGKNVKTSTMRLIGDTIVDTQGTAWEKVK